MTRSDPAHIIIVLLECESQNCDPLLIQRTREFFRELYHLFCLLLVGPLSGPWEDWVVS